MYSEIYPNLKEIKKPRNNNLIGGGIGHREVYGFDNKLWEALLATAVMEQVKVDLVQIVVAMKEAETLVEFEYPN
ncbi:hypothetical protein H5410_061020, partial [Solanum commersonii]